MSATLAGFSSTKITPQNMGFPMMGYSARESVSEGVHDPLYAKVVVLHAGNRAWAFCVLDLVAINAEMVADIRQRVSKRSDLRPEAIMISAIHTHSGPSVLDAGNWNRPFAAIVADGIVEAWESQIPAQIGTGAGFLYGYTLNRRWFERPIDPGVGVLRVDDMEGNLLGIVANFGLHAVVMGYDNLLMSADYVGYLRTLVENKLGGTCVFSNGGAANVNPITATVRQQLAERRSFTTMTGAYYYGKKDNAIELADRKGGKFEEAKEIGEAVGEEIVYVAEGVETAELTLPPWSAQSWVNHLEKDDEEELIETQALGVGDFVFVGQPGEVFVETALEIKERLRLQGYRFPWVISYANDWQAYLSPESARKEGGYEAQRASDAGHSPQVQQRLWKGISQAIEEAQSSSSMVQER
jgi:neutral ceramidase